MSQFIDKRLNGKNRSAVNRQRFIKRFKLQIKEAVSKAIQNRSIKDIESGEQIIIPAKDINEPKIYHGIGGKREFILPGNKDYLMGDKIQRQKEGTIGGNESEASNAGEGIDDFSFYLTKEEFLDMFFDDLALPDLIKTKLTQVKTFDIVRAGYSKIGTPANLNILRTFRFATARRLAFGSRLKKRIEKLNKIISELLLKKPLPKKKISNAENDIKKIQKKQSLIPFIDDFDLRYSTRVKREKHTTQAVMFCVMDVSGSMDELKKELAKRFFILLYLFLNKNYKKITIVFIRHHTTAKEVDEEEFFYSRETGGTVVSSALNLVKKIIIERFPTSDWNIYVAQASDGDNWNADSPLCGEILMKDILPYVQYYAYVEIMPRHHQSLWKTYLTVQEKFSYFSMRNINTLQDIYPVFHELFKRKATTS